MRERSSPASFEVAWRSTASARSRRIHAGAVIGDADEPKPPPASRDLDAARASIDRVLDQLLDDARRPLDDLTRGDAVDEVGGSWRIGIGRLSRAGEIPAGQHFTRFYRRLVERVDAQQMRRENRFQHEMHHERAERAARPAVQVDGADRAAMRRSAPRGWRAARRQRGRPPHGRRDSRRRQAWRGPVRDAGPRPSQAVADHGDEVLGRAVEIKLELAVLIDRAERRDGRGALAVLAEALAPELHVPGGEARETVGIGKHDVARTPRSLARPTAMAAPTAGANSAARFASSIAATTVAAPSRRASTSRPRASAGRQPDIGQSGEAAADIGIVIEHRDAELLAERAKAVGLAADCGSVTAEEEFGDALGEVRFAHGVDARRSTCTKVSGVPPDFEITTKRVVVRSRPARARSSVRASRLS